MNTEQDYDYINWNVPIDLTKQQAMDILMQLSADWETLRELRQPTRRRIDDETASDADYLLDKALIDRIQTLVRYHTRISEYMRTIDQ